jgi:hypothetical protein
MTRTTDGTAESLGRTFLDDTLLTFRRQKELAERALAQVDDGDFFRTMDAESNSIAIIVQHVGGNLKSRWTDFLTTDGEKADRNRDGEFIVGDAKTRPRSWPSGSRLGGTLRYIVALEPRRSADHGPCAW